MTKPKPSTAPRSASGGSGGRSCMVAPDSSPESRARAACSLACGSAELMLHARSHVAVRLQPLPVLLLRILCELVPPDPDRELQGIELAVVVRTGEHSLTDQAGQLRRHQVLVLVVRSHAHAQL